MCWGLPLDIGDDGHQEVGRLVLLHGAGPMKYDKTNDFTGQAGLCQVEYQGTFGVKPSFLGFRHGKFRQRNP